MQACRLMGRSARDRSQSETLAHLIRHPLRAHVLFEYTEGVTSPSRIAAKLGSPLNVVSHHTQVLLRAGAIEIVRTEPRRGAKEHFFRAVVPLVVEDDDWLKLPSKLRRAMVRGVVDGAFRQTADALVAGGMDGAETHVSRNYFSLDAQGSSELAELLRDTVARAGEIASASRERQREDAKSYELVILGFAGSGP